MAALGFSLGPREPSLVSRRRAVRTALCYAVTRLIDEHGDAELTDLLGTLADCQKARSASIHDRCKVVYGAARCRRTRLMRLGQ